MKSIAAGYSPHVRSPHCPPSTWGTDTCQAFSSQAPAYMSIVRLTIWAPPTCSAWDSPSHQPVPFPTSAHPPHSTDVCREAFPARLLWSRPLPQQGDTKAKARFAPAVVSRAVTPPRTSSCLSSPCAALSRSLCCAADASSPCCCLLWFVPVPQAQLETSVKDRMLPSKGLTWVWGNHHFPVKGMPG